MRLALLLTFVAAPVIADVQTAVQDHILPRHADLTRATADLAQTALADCAPQAVRPAFHKAYDAWIAVSHIQFGPIEDQGLSLAMAYWPDPKDSTGRALSRLSATQDAIVDDPAAFPEVSVAAQGLTSLERMLYEAQPDDAYACRLTRAIATGLAANASRLERAWPEFAALMTSAGTAGNTRFQSEAEAQRVLYTALSTGLEFLHDQRLGRPLGTFERPRPRRAEARRSQRSMRHVLLSLAALEDLAGQLVPEGGQTRAAFAEATRRAATLDDPKMEGVAEPTSRIRIEALQRAVRDIQVAIIREIGAPLGISAGFNSMDGD